MKNESLQNELKVLLGDRYSTSLSVRNNFGGGEDVFDPILPQAVVLPAIFLSLTLTSYQAAHFS